MCANKTILELNQQESLDKWQTLWMFVQWLIAKDDRSETSNAGAIDLQGFSRGFLGRSIHFESEATILLVACSPRVFSQTYFRCREMLYDD